MTTTSKEQQSLKSQLETAKNILLQITNNDERYAKIIKTAADDEEEIQIRTKNIKTHESHTPHG